MTRILVLLVTLLSVGQAQTPEAWRSAKPGDWTQLFDGETLNGWTPKITGYAYGENFGKTFRVENGVMRVSYDAYGTFKDRFGHIFYKQPFSYYVIAVEYRFTGEQTPGGPQWAFRNSGIMLHCQDPKTMGKDQDFPISIEAQLLGGNGKDARSTMNVCTPGTNIVMNGKLITAHCVNSTAPTFHGDQWVRVEVEVRGSEHIRHIVGGKTVLEYDQPQIGGGNVSNFEPSAKPDGKLLTGGYISLQSESHPVEFRKVELLSLEGCMDQKSKSYRPWNVHAVDGACK